MLKFLKLTPIKQEKRMEDLFRWAVGILGTASLTATGWIMKQIFRNAGRMNELERQQIEQKLYVVENFTKREETDRLIEKMDAKFNDMSKDIRNSLERLYEQIEKRFNGNNGNGR